MSFDQPGRRLVCECGYDFAGQHSGARKQRRFFTPGNPRLAILIMVSIATVFAVAFYLVILRDLRRNRLL